MVNTKAAFWDDLSQDMQDPAFAEEFIRQSEVVAAIDRVVAALDSARFRRGLSKAELARAVGANPAAVRRLLTARGNPTLATVIELATALDLELTLKPARPKRRDPLHETTETTA
jgi:DNA-binding phage protein